MRKLMLLLVCLLAVPAYANPTGDPLASYPVEPCRILDTRASLGPIVTGTALTVFVRGSALPASQGATNADCGIPASAQAVLVNVVAVDPGSSGVLKINGWGYVHGPAGIYSRLNFPAGQTVANEMQISLCNANSPDFPHVPCTYDNAGHYGDFQIEASFMLPGTSVHVVADVVGYLASE
jgi:hypothetical protein